MQNLIFTSFRLHSNGIMEGKTNVNLCDRHLAGKKTEYEYPLPKVLGYIVTYIEWKKATDGSKHSPSSTSNEKKYGD